MKAALESGKDGTNLRVALVHSFYSSKNPSGENVAVLQQVDALRNAGCQVEVFALRTDDEDKEPLYPIRAAWTVATGKGAAPDFSNFEPDIVHVHNLFPNYGSSWIPRVDVPVVATLHNYRPLCASGIFFRDGQVCTECLDGKSSAPAVRHGCYRSRIATVPLAIGQRFNNTAPTKAADAVISLTEQMHDLYMSSGTVGGSTYILPNFLPRHLDHGGGKGAGGFWLYVGRLSEEKGIAELIASWPPGEKNLIVVGAGELQSDIQDSLPENVHLTGPLDRADLLKLMRDAVGLVFPSKWFEGFPMVYVEALACGTPVLTWNPTVVATLVDRDGTGMVGGSTSLSDTLAAAEHTFPLLREHCRTVFEDNYSERAITDRLLNIYRGVLGADVTD